MSCRNYELGASGFWADGVVGSVCVVPNGESCQLPGGEEGTVFENACYPKDGGGDGGGGGGGEDEDQMSIGSMAEGAPVDIGDGWAPGTFFDERGKPLGTNYRQDEKCEDPLWQSCWPDPVKAFEVADMQAILPLEEPQKKKETCESLCRDRNKAIAQKCANIRKHMSLWLKEQGCPSIIKPAKSAKGGCKPCG